MRKRRGLCPVYSKEAWHGMSLLGGMLDGLRFGFLMNTLLHDTTTARPIHLSTTSSSFSAHNRVQIRHNHPDVHLNAPSCHCKQNKRNNRGNHTWTQLNGFRSTYI